MPRKRFRNPRPDPDEVHIARCKIPQTDLVDPVYISENYSYEIIAEAWMFKRVACEGANELGHVELARKILDQMQILTSAQSLTPEYKKDQENDAT